MNIIIVGCGNVGRTLAAQLNAEGNNVTVIDTVASKVNEITERYDIMGIVGNGATHLVQQEAGIKRADLLIAVTASDELNLLCCLIAKKAGNCHTIARVRSPQYSSEAPYLKDELGLAMVINPEQAAAAEIARVLRFPSAIKIDTFSKGRVELLKFRLPENSPLVSYSVKEISTKFHCDVLVCTVERGDEAYIANGDFIFAEKDVISIIAAPRNANKFFKAIDYKINSVKDVIITGGSEITYYLCRILQRSGINVKVIEGNSDRCNALCDQLDDVTIINAEPSDQDNLLEAGLEGSDGFAALTGIDEENILLSLFAKSKGAAKIVTKINRIDFGEVIKQLDLDSIIYPKNITTEYIVRYVRAMEKSIGSNMETLYNIIPGKIEAAEFSVKETSGIVGKPLMDIKFKSGILVAAILRDRKVIIPRGHDTIEIGDSVVIVSNHLSLHDITDILK